MLLVDKDMKSLIEKGKFIINGFNQNNLNGVSYDITVDSIIDGNSNLDTYELAPNSIVIVRCKEVLLVPDDIVVRVAEKNSLIRYNDPQFLEGRQPIFQFHKIQKKVPL